MTTSVEEEYSTSRASPYSNSDTTNTTPVSSQVVPHPSASLYERWNYELGALKKKIDRHLFSADTTMDLFSAAFGVSSSNNKKDETRQQTIPSRLPKKNGQNKKRHRDRVRLVLPPQQKVPPGLQSVASPKSHRTERTERKSNRYNDVKQRRKTFKASPPVDDFERLWSLTEGEDSIADVNHTPSLDVPACLSNKKLFDDLPQHPRTPTTNKERPTVSNIPVQSPVTDLVVHPNSPQLSKTTPYSSYIQKNDPPSTARAQEFVHQNQTPPRPDAPERSVLVKSPMNLELSPWSFNTIDAISQSPPFDEFLEKGVVDPVEDEHGEKKRPNDAVDDKPRENGWEDRVEKTRHTPRPDPFDGLSIFTNDDLSTASRLLSKLPTAIVPYNPGKITKLKHVSDMTLRDPYGDSGSYTGVVVHGRPHCHGTMVYQDGRNYKGTWKNGRWDGYGQATFANGDCYTGEYKRDTKEGIGRYQWADGRVYDGAFGKDARNGSGVYSWPNGSCYHGTFVDGLRHGEGTYTYSDGSVYSGEWKKGHIHGKGEMVWSNGRCYKGEWRDGHAHGYGVECRSDGTIRHDGQWKRDRPVRKKSGPPPSQSSSKLRR